MKKYFLLFGLFIIGLSSCKKPATFDAAAQAATDDLLIQAYIKQYNIPAIKDPSGLYYQIITPGTGPHPTDSSNITVGYTCTLIDGTAIDSRSSSYFAPLGLVIEGWRIGLPLIGTGGKILLLVPSALGYGNAAQGAIPANSVLIYNITLQGFN
jgi:FKBP-type peptidyl-prolyl cis-trans isomerase FkpA